MFDLDAWQEIFDTIRRNRLRTLMTAAGVFWGTFMLLIMLGIGGGLERGVAGTVRGFGSNGVYLWGSTTRMPFKGLKPGRSIVFDNADLAALRAELDGLDLLAPRNQLGGWRGSHNVTVGAKTGSYGVSGDVPEYLRTQPMLMTSGRFVNALDLQQARKVAVIGRQVQRELFPEGADPVGAWLQVNGISFRIVGVFRSTESGDRADRVNAAVHIPLTTFQHAFNEVDRIGWIALTARPEVSAADLEERARALLGARHAIHPDDRQALNSWNSGKDFERVENLFAGIRFFVWLVGLATLASGVVGVSNIMLIIVRERTGEIGLRRAIGATPAAIVAMVVKEAVVLTCLSGYAGLVAGVAVLELVGQVVGPDNEMLSQPTIDISVTLIAAVVLVVAGAMAGALPARRAIEIHPVDALRAE